jgi:hypothetical protein
VVFYIFVVETKKLLHFYKYIFVFLVPPPYAPPMPPSVASSTTEISWRGSSKMSITRKPARV